MLITGIATGIIIARVLGPEGKGLLAIFQVLPVLVVTFGELGIRQSTAYLLGRRTYSEKDIQSSMMALYLVSASIGLTIVLIGYWSFGAFKYGLLVSIIFALMVPTGLLQRYANGLLLGRKQIDKINYTQLLDGCGRLILIIVFIVFLGWGVLGAGISFIVAQVFSVSLLLFWISRYASLKPKWISPIPGEMLKKGILFAVSLFVLMLNYRVDILMLGKMQTNASVGIYSLGVNICELLWQCPLSVGIVLFSRSLNWSDKSAKANITHVYLLTRLLLPVVTILSLLLILSVYFLIPILYGAAFANSFWVMCFLLPGTVPLTIFLFLHFYAAGQGLPHMTLKGFIPGLIVNVILNYYLIPLFGYIGAALSSTLSYTLSILIYLHFFRERYGGSLREMFIFKKDDISQIKKFL